MIQLDLTKEELQTVINMMQNSNVQMAFAEPALKLFNKLKEANK